MTQENTPSNPLLQWIEQDAPQSALWRSERGNAPPKRILVVDDTLSADEAYRLAAAGVGMLWRGDFQNAKLLVQALERRLEKRMEKNASPKPARNKDRKAADAAPNAKSARAAALAVANGNVEDSFDDGDAFDTTSSAVNASNAPIEKASANLGAAPTAARSTVSASSVAPSAKGAHHTQDPQDDVAKQFYKHRQAQAQRARVLGLILIPLDADFSVPLPRAPDVKLACSQAWGEPVSAEKSVTSLRE